MQVLNRQMAAARVGVPAGEQGSATAGFAGAIVGVPGKTTGGFQVMDLSRLRDRLAPDARGQVHEEQLQYALIAELLEMREPGLGGQFEALFARMIGTGEPALMQEDSSRLSLLALAKRGLIDKEAAENIFNLSFRAAQLDGHVTALWDNRGGANDISIAVKPLDEAVGKVAENLARVESGEISLPGRALEQAPFGTFYPGPLPTGAAADISRSGFLWKPVSDKDGRLVVLLPGSLRGRVMGAELWSDLVGEGGRMIERGQYSGDWGNGGRAHFRFSKPGGVYPDGAVVVARLTDGEVLEFPIPETARRVEL